LPLNQIITTVLEIESHYWNGGLQRVAGVDEAGRGPMAGPVVAAAVLFPAETLIDGVRDSKQLTAKKREELYGIILEKAQSVGVGIVDSQEIDRLNIRQATLLAMQKAVQQLNPYPQAVLIDGLDTIPGLGIDQKPIVDGDQICFTISAASIIAKVTRDRLMIQYDQRFPQYGFGKHKGYGTQAHRLALKKFGPCEIHRCSFQFKTT